MHVLYTVHVHVVRTDLQETERLMGLSRSELIRHKEKNKN